MKTLYVPILLSFLIFGCSKPANTNPDLNPEPGGPVLTLMKSTNDYDAVYYPSGAGLPYPYHVSQILYMPEGRQFVWSTTVNRSTEILYSAEGAADTSAGHNKGCIALEVAADSSQQNSHRYTGSYYKFSLFNDTAVGNLQFMIPADDFPTIDSIPVTPNSSLVFKGGLNSYYYGMTKSEVKITPILTFVQSGDSTSYANPLFPASGSIDSVEVTMMVTRFSDNKFRSSSTIARTIDANYTATFYFNDGGRFSLINGKFTNLFFQKVKL